jgi:ATP-dependent protease HslVU (ClpYQ) ATPase subunit
MTNANDKVVYVNKDDENMIRMLKRMMTVMIMMRTSETNAKTADNNNEEKITYQRLWPQSPEGTVRQRE